MKVYFLSAALLAIVPRLLLAQSTSDRRPFYVELRGSHNNCEIRYQNGNGVIDINPLDKSLFPFTVGYYFTPRFAVQLGGSYVHITYNSPGGIRQDPAGTSILGATDYTHTRGSVSTLLRYAVLPQKNRLQVDALLELMWARDAYISYSYSTFNGAITSEQTRRDNGAQFIATAGVGFRWVFSRHFELMYDHAWNRNLDGAPPYLRQQIIGNSNGLTNNRSIALRYRFNWGKPAPQPAQ